MSKEYIDREAAEKVAAKYGCTNGATVGIHSGIADCIAFEIAKLPAADVVEVVRRKDCVYYDFEKGCPFRESGYFCDGKPFPHENDFCSYSKRKGK